MKKTLCILTITGLLSLASQAAVIVADSFFTGGTDEYVAGAVNNQNPSAAGTGWSGGWGPASAGTRFLAAQTGDLALYSDGTNTITRAQTGGSAGSAIISGSSGNDTTRRSFSAVSSGDLYFSFLFSGTPGNANSAYSLGSDADSAFNSAYMLRYDDVDGSIELAYNNGAQIVDSSVSFASANFLIARITDIGSTSSTFSLWVNPNDLSDLANETAAATISISGTSIGANHFSARYFGSDVNDTMDELRIGTTFEDVTGVVQIPEPSTYALLALAGLALFTLRRYQAKA